MGSPGMRYSLVSREVIADSIETVVGAEGFDGLVAIGGCDKNIPGCAMAIARLNRPAVFVYGGTIRPGIGRRDIVSVFEAVGEPRGRQDQRCRAARGRAHRDPGPGQLRRHVHRQHDGLGDRGAGPEPARQLGAGSGRHAQARGLPARRRAAVVELLQGRACVRGDILTRKPLKTRSRDDRAGRLDQRRAASAGDRAGRRRAAHDWMTSRASAGACRCWRTCGPAATT